MTLRQKLIAFTLLVSVGSLAIFGFVTIIDFRQDKVAYVQDANTQAAVHGAEIINLLISGRLRTLAPLISQIDQKTGIDSKAADNLAAVKELEGLAIRNEHAPVDASLSWARGQKYFRDQTPDFSKTSTVVEQVAGTMLWRLSSRLNDTSGLVLEAVWNDDPFAFIRDNTGAQDYFVLGPKSEILVAPSQPQFSVAPDFSSISFSEMLGQFQVKTQNLKIGKETWLVGVSRLASGDIFIIAGTPQKVAFAATQKLIIKTLLFSVFLIFLIIAISLFSTGKITQTLTDLAAATFKISQGDYNVSISNQSKDEIGLLANRFSAMAVEIKRLLSETAEKARMDNELKTAKAVQEQMFPTTNLSSKDIEIEGYYESASECSGDWWFYQDYPEYVLFCIGDVTGHGAPAALMTSAARSAFATLVHIPDASLDRLMSLINEALYSMSRGATTMTFLLGKYRKADGVVEYCNASHHPPVYLPYKDNLKKKDLQFLDIQPGPAFASLPQAKYQRGEFQLQPGDALFLYTDGILEMQNKKLDMYGERRLYKAMMSVGLHRDQIIKVVTEDFKQFHGGATLQDDVTLLVVRRPPMAEETVIAV